MEEARPQDVTVPQLKRWLQRDKCFIKGAKQSCCKVNTFIIHYLLLISKFLLSKYSFA